jgi:predicted outer membrane repeat protein
MNSGVNGGGAVLVDFTGVYFRAILVIDSSVFEGNSVDGQGGAIFVTNAGLSGLLGEPINLTLSNNTFRGNTATYFGDNFASMPDQIIIHPVEANTTFYVSENEYLAFDVSLVNMNFFRFAWESFYFFLFKRLTFSTIRCAVTLELSWSSLKSSFFVEIQTTCGKICSKTIEFPSSCSWYFCLSRFA